LEDKEIKVIELTNLEFDGLSGWAQQNTFNCKNKKLSY
jgi:hypothetical protein